VAAGLLLVLAAWAFVADAGGRQQSSRDAGHPSRREGQGSDSKVGPRATAKAPKSNDASGDSVTLSPRELQERLDAAARDARNREKAQQESKKEQEKVALDRKRRAIRRLLEEDEKVAEETKGQIKDSAHVSKYVDAIGEYCTRCEKIDTTDCPAPVLVAYQRHIAAWRAFARVVRPYCFSALQVEGLKALLDLNHPDWASLQLANREVKRTWGDVTDRAAEYDVVLGR
jgi:hypothetical protein